jgi:hypothetical protein
MDTKISEIISILPADLQPLLLQHKEFMVLLGQVIANYENVIANLQEQIAFLESEIKRLKDLLQLDSHNSTPSTDLGRKKKIPSIRKVSGLSPGGQKGPMEQLLNKYPIPTIRTRLKWLFVNIAEKSYLLFHRKRLKKDKFLIYRI